MGKKKPAKEEISSEPVAPPMSDEEKQEALALLRSPDILSLLLDDIEKIGCVGEEENKMMIALALTSRLDNEPIGLICKGESSSGKSFTVSRVASFFPPEDIIQVTAISAKALYHYTGSLAHKALIICERPGAEASDYPIRALLSEREIQTLVTETGKRQGQFSSVKKTVKGPVAYIETTTKPIINPENENRCFELSPDESQEQTRKIQEHQRASCNRPPVNIEAIVAPWRNAQRLLEPLSVQIPFGHLIEFPSDAVRTRRDFPRFLSLIRASALLHQKQRQIVVQNGRRMLVAEIKDYAIACDLATKVLIQTITGLTPAAKIVLDKIAELVESRKESPNDHYPDAEFTVQDVEDFSGLTLRTIQRYVSVCKQNGYVAVVEAKKGCLYRYKFVRLSSAPRVGLLTPEELEAQWGRSEPVTVPEVRQEQLAQSTALQPV